MVMGDVEDIAHDVQVDVHDDQDLVEDLDQDHVEDLDQGPHDDRPMSTWGGKKKIFHPNKSPL